MLIFLVRLEHDYLKAISHNLGRTYGTVKAFRIRDKLQFYPHSSNLVREIIFPYKAPKNILKLTIY